MSNGEDRAPVPSGLAVPMSVHEAELHRVRKETEIATWNAAREAFVSHLGSQGVRVTEDGRVEFHEDLIAGIQRAGVMGKLMEHLAQPVTVGHLIQMIEVIQGGATRERAAYREPEPEREPEPLPATNAIREAVAKQERWREEGLPRANYVAEHPRDRIPADRLSAFGGDGTARDFGGFSEAKPLPSDAGSGIGPLGGRESRLSEVIANVERNARGR